MASVPAHLHKNGLPGPDSGWRRSCQEHVIALLLPGGAALPPVSPKFPTEVGQWTGDLLSVLSMLSLR